MLTHTGYDTYEGMPAGSPSGTIDNTYITSTNFFTTYNAVPDYAQQIVQSNQNRGLATWTKIKGSGTSTFCFQ